MKTFRRIAISVTELDSNLRIVERELYRWEGDNYEPEIAWNKFIELCNDGLPVYIYYNDETTASILGESYKYRDFYNQHLPED